MKKTIIALSALIALSVAISVFGFDMNPKKKACEAGCDTTYNNCKESAEKDYKKDKNETKKAAKIEACKAAKNECYKKCNK